MVGLHAGSRFTIDQMGVVGPALAHSASLDAALDTLVRIMSAFVENAGIRRLDDDRGAAIEYRMPALRSRHGVDTIFAATLALVRHCTGARVVPLAVEHQMPRCAEGEYAAFFGVAPRWQRPASQLWFARGDLARPFLGASPELAALLAEHAPRLLGPDGHAASRDDEIERAFWAAHQRGGATLETTAEVLGVSARTLQRRLALASTSFADRRAELLHRRATQLLCESETPIDAIGERLGYASRAAFERAFVRWSGGKTPHTVRTARRGRA